MNRDDGQQDDYGNSGDPQQQQQQQQTPPQAPVDPKAATVADMYRNALGREASPEEIQNQLSGGSGDMATIYQGIYGSPEAQAYKNRAQTQTAQQPQAQTQASAPGAPQPAPTPVVGGGPQFHPGEGLYTTGGPGNPTTASPSSSPNATFQGVNSDLYQQLLTRAHQGTQINADDPNIRQQVDPFAAQQERQRRNYMADVAEQSGPLANLAGENRLSSERAGQATGMLQSQLVGGELKNRRDEIQNALTQLGSQLTADQSMGLQRELGYLNNSLGKYGIDTTAGLTQQQINSNNDQFNAQFGFNTTDRASYWDAVRRGLI